MKRFVQCVALCACLSTAVGAQQVPAPPEKHGSSWVVHYGKWLAAAAAIGFTVLGAQEHNKSNDVYSGLLDLCREDDSNCVLTTNGTYVDPTAEEMYQSSLSYDRRARARLIAGQAMLLLCAGLFVADLRHKGPENIPVHFDPVARTAGVTLRF